MSVTLRYYIRIFLFTGGGFAGGMFFINQMTGDPVSLFEFLFHFIFFGGFMTLLYAPGNIKTLKSLGVSKIAPEHLSVIQKRIIVSYLSKEDVVERIQESRSFSKMNMRIGEDEIQLVSKFSWDLWGDKISIKIRSLEEGLNEYSVISQPRMKTIRFDSGQNFKNVTLIERMLGSATETVATI